MGTACVIFRPYFTFYLDAYPGELLSSHWMRWVLYVGVIPLLMGAAVYGLTRRYGLLTCWWVVLSCALPLFTIASFASLVSSFSRGGMLAFAAATAFTTAIAVWSRWRPRLPFKRMGAAAVVILLIAVSVAALRTEPSRAAQEAAGRRIAIQRDGVDVTASDLTNPATMMLRLMYWRIGCAMALDNFWGGVGLGNFGVMYPRYRYTGAGETKQAHNDYLQVLCETGVFGAALFCAFWLVFVLRGVRWILRNGSSPELWLAAGLFGGVLAFLLHSFVDFDFFNPSLATFAFLLSGLFLAVTAGGKERGPAKPVSRVVGGLFLLVAMVIAGASWRVHSADALAGPDTDIRGAYLAGTFFLFQTDPADFDPKSPPSIRLTDAIPLIRNSEVLTSFATLWAAEPGRPLRPLTSREPFGPETVLRIRDPEAAQTAGAAAFREYLSVLVAADAVFPYDPMRAHHIANFYEILGDYEKDGAERSKCYGQAVTWAVEACERSPYSSWLAASLRRSVLETRRRTVERGAVDRRPVCRSCLSRQGHEAVPIIDPRVGKPIPCAEAGGESVASPRA